MVGRGEVGLTGAEADHVLARRRSALALASTARVADSAIAATRLEILSTAAIVTRYRSPFQVEIYGLTCERGRQILAQSFCTTITFTGDR